MTLGGVSINLGAESVASLRSWSCEPSKPLEVGAMTQSMGHYFLPKLWGGKESAPV